MQTQWLGAVSLPEGFTSLCIWHPNLLARVSHSAWRKGHFDTLQLLQGSWNFCLYMQNPHLSRVPTLNSQQHTDEVRIHPHKTHHFCFCGSFLLVHWKEVKNSTSLIPPQPWGLGLSVSLVRGVSYVLCITSLAWEHAGTLRSHFQFYLLSLHLTYTSGWITYFLYLQWQWRLFFFFFCFAVQGIKPRAYH